MTALIVEPLIQDRRKFVRYQLSLPVIFGSSATDESQRRTGFTRDVSAGGAFVMTFRTSSAPPAGASIWLELDLPEWLSGSKQPSFMTMDAQCKRVETDGFAISFATAVEE